MPGDSTCWLPAADFLYSLTTGAPYIESGRYNKVVVVGADKMSSIVDYSDRSTCISLATERGRPAGT